MMAAALLRLQPGMVWFALLLALPLTLLLWKAGIRRYSAMGA